MPQRRMSAKPVSEAPTERDFDLAKMAAPARKTGFLDKEGRGRRFAFYQPWRKRLFDLDPDSFALTYSADGTVKGKV